MSRKVVWMTNLAALAAAALLQGCASAPAASTVQAAPGYREVFIESFEVAPGALPKATVAERAEVTQNLRTALEGSLSERQALASSAGPGVLSVVITVDAIDTSSPAANVISSLIAFVPLDTGGATLHASYFDGETHQWLGERSWKHKSTPLAIKGSLSRYGHAAGALRTFGQELLKAQTDQSGPKALASSSL